MARTFDDKEVGASSQVSLQDGLGAAWTAVVATIDLAAYLDVIAALKIAIVGEISNARNV